MGKEKNEKNKINEKQEEKKVSSWRELGGYLLSFIPIAIHVFGIVNQVLKGSSVSDNGALGSNNKNSFLPEGFFPGVESQETMFKISGEFENEFYEIDKDGNAYNNENYPGYLNIEYGQQFYSPEEMYHETDEETQKHFSGFLKKAADAMEVGEEKTICVDKKVFTEGGKYAQYKPRCGAIKKIEKETFANAELKHKEVRGSEIEPIKFVLKEEVNKEKKENYRGSSL